MYLGNKRTYSKHSIIWVLTNNHPRPIDGRYPCVSQNGKSPCVSPENRKLKSHALANAGTFLYSGTDVSSADKRCFPQDVWKIHHVVSHSSCELCLLFLALSRHSTCSSSNVNPVPRLYQSRGRRDLGHSKHKGRRVVLLNLVYC